MSKKKKRSVRIRKGKNHRMMDEISEELNVGWDVGAEPITEQLIKEFTAKGMTEESLLFIKEEGGKFSREKDTFVFPWHPFY